jgi:hypothetical protein
MELELFKILSAGGDVATIALAAAIWKLDRRMLRVELKLWPERS